MWRGDEDIKIKDMPCPHGWNNCTDCKNVDLCKVGLYKPESSDLDILIQAAKMAEEVVTKDAIESAEEIKRGTWMEELDQATGTDEFWTWFAKYRRPCNINYKEPLKAGPSKPGGGSRNKAEKNKTGNKVYTDVWSGF